MHDLTDDQLVARANDGDAEAFTALYERYRVWVWQLAWRHTMQRERAEDVTQEAFLWLLRKFPGFHLEASMKSVLYPVTVHLARDVRTRERRRQTEPLPVEASGIDSRAGSSRADLQRALAMLPEGQREAVLLRFVDELSLDEIARCLDIPPGTVKSRLHHALAALRADESVRKFFIE